MSNVITPKEDHVFIATYGSLRRGMSNYTVNQRGGGIWVGRGKTVDDINLYRYHGCYFPSISLAHSSHGSKVVVDVFEAPSSGLFGAYDCLEGYPSFYNRTKVMIDMDGGSQLEAWIYHIDQEQEEPVVSGDWCLHNNPNYYEDVDGDSDE
ncbi:gamma-glutamyl cyclotransferase [Aeromonas phage BUCT695]|uniref:gamma-glutamyl cyclotransferase n=1 Tax=Aeromonas phage BUCT695 TaxID=2908630 RepID=UPI0023293D9E|nr:gamma-glutamyl cyclotransferase [Aeromonas phage BUCT695]UIW10527.1 gamma-glutamyl cyclotransferase [Aeromonas phage BUCT695]